MTYVIKHSLQQLINSLSLLNQHRIHNDSKFPKRRKETKYVKLTKQDNVQLG